MGRELRRVPLDFQYPWHKPWYGYFISNIATCMGTDGSKQYCEQCLATAKIKGVPIMDIGCPDWEAYLQEPIQKMRDLLAHPIGEGFQLWETTTEGSPISPVFQTLDELCAWCEDNATVFAYDKISKEKWKSLLTECDGMVFYEDNNGVLVI